MGRIAFVDFQRPEGVFVAFVGIFFKLRFNAFESFAVPDLDL